MDLPSLLGDHVIPDSSSGNDKASSTTSIDSIAALLLLATNDNSKEGTPPPTGLGSESSDSQDAQQNGAKRARTGGAALGGEFTRAPKQQARGNATADNAPNGPILPPLRSKIPPNTLQMQQSQYMQLMQQQAQLQYMQQMAQLLQGQMQQQQQAPAPQAPQHVQQQQNNQHQMQMQQMRQMHSQLQMHNQAQQAPAAPLYAQEPSFHQADRISAPTLAPAGPVPVDRSWSGSTGEQRMDIIDPATLTFGPPRVKVKQRKLLSLSLVSQHHKLFSALGSRVVRMSFVVRLENKFGKEPVATSSAEYETEIPLTLQAAYHGVHVRALSQSHYRVLLRVVVLGNDGVSTQVLDSTPTDTIIPPGRCCKRCSFRTNKDVSCEAMDACTNPLRKACNEDDILDGEGNIVARFCKSGCKIFHTINKFDETKSKCRVAAARQREYDAKSQKRKRARPSAVAMD